MFSYQKCKPEKYIIDTIFGYDVRKLEQTPSIDISRYTIALSQYLIFLKSNVNKLKAEVAKDQRFMDSTVRQLLTKDLLSKYKTKTDAVAALLESTDTLTEYKDRVESNRDQLLLLDGIDKTISELIAAFKRELTRRENEYWQTSKEH